ncbi:uncharacterized protein LOC106173690 [Lingula anatina]|uniref:Uncharacterized protein LOC106173690 n=1 Tax=Lingula anatina TaxID=7574 RepID=A0A1S3JJP4_LINAN|nr:uncharacterized protein LOC106173690 [Lingula anatina]XP_013410352.1 uncharacterized protein LOC106173690 [Lingula anatina]|eukprot:XP_013410351.1 uncharacterized protein LOC106173690 [Lingula anatina]
MVAKVIAILLLLHSSAILAQSQFKAPDYEWSKHVVIGGSEEFNCNETNYMAPLQPSDRIEWVLPDSKRVTTGWSDDHRSLRNITNAGHIINAIMHIKDVQPSIFGYYICRVSRNAGSEVGYTRYGLNLGGAPFADPWEKYQYNLMVGGIAGAVVLVVSTFLCLVYKFRYKELEDGRYKDTSRYTGQPMKSTAVYDNAAMDSSQDSIFKNGDTKPAASTDTHM